tara:strand:- start:117 stop:224 length:108 start_codon:yes stop_codon:yes gene_type:complete
VHTGEAALVVAEQTKMKENRQKVQSREEQNEPQKL